MADGEINPKDFCPHCESISQDEMICCTKCEQWEHGDCVGLNPDQVEARDGPGIESLCVACKKEKKKNKKSKKSKVIY
jgi:hypothetical protein